MKRKTTLVLLSLVCVLCCAFGLTACGGGNASNGSGTDKSFQNVEFVEYREKTVAVLKDNGIKVNDINTAKSGTKNSVKRVNKAVALSASYPDNANTIQDIIMNANPSEALSRAKDERNDIFEQTLYVSLIMGDAISNYHNEIKFYDIPVYFEYWTQYFEVVKNGDNDYVRCYTPNDDSVLTMELDYKSATNYSFTCMQIWETQSIYCYGNSQKEFFLLCRDFGENNGNWIYYMSNADEGYYSESETAADECYRLVEGTLQSVDKSSIKSLPNRKKYTITKQQGEQTLEKYFGDTGPSENVPRGMIYAEMGGVKFGEWYSAFDEKVITIPAECEYLSEQFSIKDNTNSVEKVIIPSTVKGIVTEHNYETGEAYETPRIINVDNLNEDDFRQLRYWFLDIECEGNNGSKKLQEIEVENGSTYFKAGKGNLYSASGKLLYLADKSLGTTFSVADYDDDTLNSIYEGIKEESYRHLLNDVTTLNITLPFENQLFMYATENMPKLNSLNISGEVFESQWSPELYISVFNDLTVTIDATCTLRDGLPRLNFASKQSHNVIINIPYVCPIPSYGSYDDIAFNVKVGIPEELYIQIFGWINENNDIHFADGDLTDAQKQAFDFRVHNRSEMPELTAVWRNASVDMADVPRTYGMDVTALSVWAYNMQDKTINVRLHDNIRYLLFEGDQGDVQNLSLTYDGTIAEFEESVQIICYVQGYSFVLKDKDDNTKTYSGGFSVPREELCTITLVYTNKMGNEQTVVIENHRKGFLLNVYEYEEAMRESDEDIIGWLGDDGVFLNNQIIPNKDTEYVAVKIRALLQDFSISYNGLDLTFNYYWSSGTIENCNALYNGTSLISYDRDLREVCLIHEDKNDYFEIKLKFGFRLDNDGYITIYIKDMEIQK